MERRREDNAAFHTEAHESRLETISQKRRSNKTKLQRTFKVYLNTLRYKQPLAVLLPSLNTHWNAVKRKVKDLALVVIVYLFPLKK